MQHKPQWCAALLLTLAACAGRAGTETPVRRASDSAPDTPQRQPAVSRVLPPLEDCPEYLGACLYPDSLDAAAPEVRTAWTIAQRFLTLSVELRPDADSIDHFEEIVDAYREAKEALIDSLGVLAHRGVQAERSFVYALHSALAVHGVTLADRLVSLAEQSGLEREDWAHARGMYWSTMLLDAHNHLEGCARESVGPAQEFCSERVEQYQRLFREEHSAERERLGM